jgi:hypothetical protein
MEARERIILAFVERLLLNENGLDIDGWTPEHVEEVASALEKVDQSGAGMLIRNWKERHRRIECSCAEQKTCILLCVECASVALRRQILEEQVDELAKMVKTMKPKTRSTPEFEVKLTFGELNVGDRFIGFPLPGDNEGHGGYLGGQFIWKKTESRSSGAMVPVSSGAAVNGRGVVSHFPYTMDVVKVLIE